MSRRGFARLAVLCLAIVVAVAPAEARRAKKKAGNTEPGTYKGWGPDIDEIEIVKSFEAAGYKNIVVVPFDVSEVQLPDKDDNTYEPVQQVLADATTPFAKALGEKSNMSVKVEAKPKKASETLIVRGKVLTMAPGSQAARYFAGFGAGATRAKVQAEVVDAATNTVLLRFTQERRSGVGMLGGGYVELMNRNLEAIGEDTANILSSF